MQNYGGNFAYAKFLDILNCQHINNFVGATLAVARLYTVLQVTRLTVCGCTYIYAATNNK